jgi:hypothetical protein
LSTSVSWPAITTSTLTQRLAQDGTPYSFYFYPGAGNCEFYYTIIGQGGGIYNFGSGRLNFRSRLTNWLSTTQWRNISRTDSTPTTKNVTWENASGTAYTNTETPYLCVIEPTANTTYIVGSAANVEYIYNSVYNSYIVNTAALYSNILSTTIINSYLQNVCYPATETQDCSNPGGDNITTDTSYYICPSGGTYRNIYVQ